MPKGSWREFSIPSDVSLERTELISDKSKWKVRVQKTRVGKGGKTVTIIRGLKLSDSEFRSLLKILKSSCGTGGTFKEDFLELQGDQVENVIAALESEGYFPKRSGG